MARVYRRLETIAFGNALQCARVAFLSQVRNCRNALIVGEGNGRFLRALLQSNPEIMIDCVDASEQMLLLARAGTRARFHHVDFRKWSSDQTRYDLIVTHFFLDCFDAEELPRVIEKLVSFAAPNACWLLSDFAQPMNGWRRLHAKMWLGAMYLFFRLTTGLQTRALVDSSRFLKTNGFVLREEKCARAGLVRAQLWDRS